VGIEYTRKFILVINLSITLPLARFNINTSEKGNNIWMEKLADVNSKVNNNGEEITSVTEIW
jgi:hypothetical protein